MLERLEGSHYGCITLKASKLLHFKFRKSEETGKLMIVEQHNQFYGLKGDFNDCVNNGLGWRMIRDNITSNIHSVTFKNTAEAYAPARTHRTSSNWAVMRDRSRLKTRNFASPVSSCWTEFFPSFFIVSSIKLRSIFILLKQNQSYNLANSHFWAYETG